MAATGHDAERWRRIEQLCHDALERPAGERERFLAVACEGDEALRREVDALLAHDDSVDRFLAEPLGVVAANLLLDRDHPETQFHAPNGNL